MLAGDALLAEAFRLACSYPTADVARELAEATLGMIGGQYLDTMEPGTDLETVHRLKTGCLFYASVTLALWAAELPREEQGAWRDFADELGMLFQVVDDILDADGYVLEEGVEAARARARTAPPSGRSRCCSRSRPTRRCWPRSSSGLAVAHRASIVPDEEAPGRPARRARASRSHARRRRR